MALLIGCQREPYRPYCGSLAEHFGGKCGGFSRTPGGESVPTGRDFRYPFLPVLARKRGCWKRPGFPFNSATATWRGGGRERDSWQQNCCCLQVAESLPIKGKTFSPLLYAAKANGSLSNTSTSQVEFIRHLLTVLSSEMLCCFREREVGPNALSEIRKCVVF